jgi:hypothetical protein
MIANTHWQISRSIALEEHDYFETETVPRWRTEKVYRLMVGYINVGFDLHGQVSRVSLHGSGINKDGAPSKVRRSTALKPEEARDVLPAEIAAAVFAPLDPPEWVTRRNSEDLE